MSYHKTGEIAYAIGGCHDCQRKFEGKNARRDADQHSRKLKHHTEVEVTRKYIYKGGSNGAS